MTLYVCESCGLLGAIDAFQEECSPGWTHGRLVKVGSQTAEVVERLAHQLRVALTVIDPGGYGTWRGNAQRALAEAERRGLVSAHTPSNVRTEGV